MTDLQTLRAVLEALHKEVCGDFSARNALRALREARERERIAADRAHELSLLRKTLVPREGAPPTYMRAPSSRR